jgi:hypothetical protein
MWTSIKKHDKEQELDGLCPHCCCFLLEAYPMAQNQIATFSLFFFDIAAATAASPVA